MRAASHALFIAHKKNVHPLRHVLAEGIQNICGEKGEGEEIFFPFT